MVQELTEPHQRLVCRSDTHAMFIQHGLLGRGVTAKDRADQQAVMLSQGLQRHLDSAMQLHEPLLTAAAKQ